MKDFFISYTSADRQWAEWLDGQLRRDGYTTVLQSQDFQAGSNFVLEMDRAAKETRRTLAVLSSRYLAASFTHPEWAAAFARDPKGLQRLLIPVRIEACDPVGLLAQVVYIDLVGLAEEAAKTRFLEGIRGSLSDEEPQQPEIKPPFPAGISDEKHPEPRFPGTLPQIYNLQRRNPNFTGRDQLLLDLRNSLTSGHHIAITQQSLYGLGGIGKTQLAVEYAWRHCASYEVIWWLRANEVSTLSSDYANLAGKLNLREKDEAEQKVIVEAVRYWLDHHPQWLLIFDNAPNHATIRDFLPNSVEGHVLITSRNQDWKKACSPVEMTVWNRAESISFLNKRTRLSDEPMAGEVAEALGDLPLALEQGAAYIDTKGKSYAEYLTLFNSRRQELWKRETPPEGYPATVATTWSLAFDQIQTVTCAKELLSLASLVAPDAIPKTLLNHALESYFAERENSFTLDPFRIDDAVGALRSYSLLSIEANHAFVHRLVQTVVRDHLLAAELTMYRDALIVALSQQFPDEGYKHPKCWPLCAALFPHAVALTENMSIENCGKQLEQALLLNNMGRYLYGGGAYHDAEPLFRRALEIRKSQLGDNHLDVAMSMNDLAVLLVAQGKPIEAEPLYKQALAVREQQLGKEDPDVATSLNNLATVLQSQEKYAEAESLCRQALAIKEKQLGKEHPYVAISLNELATILQDQRKYDQAEKLYRQALAINEKQLGKEHPYVAKNLSNLASVLKHNQGKLTQAEQLYRQALAIIEKQLGINHPDVARSLRNLAMVLQDQRKFPQVKSFLQRAYSIYKQALGEKHPNTISTKKELDAFLKKRW
jgi:tetratricopeptide (TPR) repeat protein